MENKTDLSLHLNYYFTLEITYDMKKKIGIYFFKHFIF